MSVLDWLIVIVLNGGVMLYGIWLARGTKTSSDWFLGKRSLTWWAIGLSMFATNVDNADLVSMTGKTYGTGMHLIMVHTLGALIGVSFAAFCLVPAMAKAGHFTNAEYLEARFGPSARVLSALIQIQYRTSMLGLMIWSLYLLLTSFLGLEIRTAWILIVAIVAIAGVYTSWGGLRSVVFTDAIQGLIMFVGMAVIFTAVWQAAGGWSGAISKLEAIDLDDQRKASELAKLSGYFGPDGTTSPFVVALGWIIIACGYWSVNHTQTMRLAGARSIWDMKVAALFGALISMPIMVGLAMLGVLGRSLFPDLNAIGLDNPDKLYPYMADLYLGAGLKGFVVAGILAAAVSTFDSMGSSLSALFTRDIYARLIAKNREDAHYVAVSRWATAGVLAIGFAYIPFIRSTPTMLDAFLTLIPVFVTPMFTIYVVGVLTRAPARCGIVGILTGSAFGLIALVDRQFYDVAWIPAWLTNPWPAYSWAIVFTLLGVAIGAFLTPAKIAAANHEATWLETSSCSLDPLPDHPFKTAPPRWASPEIIAGVLIVATALVLGVFFW